MTREEVIGKEKEPCEMTVEEYRQRMIQAFHNADCDELIAICVLPTEKEFEHLEWLLRSHYKNKKEPKTDYKAFAKWIASEIFDENWEYNKDSFAELACRKLAKLGIVRAKGDEWELVVDHDCISRSDVMVLIERTNLKYLSGFRRGISQKAFDDLLNETIALPPVTPQPKTTHWIRQADDYHDYYECEQCGIAVGLDDIKNYCPNCGAKMEEMEGNDDE